MTAARKISSAIVTAVFVVMIASPLFVLAVRGAVEPYGQLTFTSFPPVEALTSSSGGAFDQLASALLDRSQLKKTAITVRNTVLLKVVQQYDHNEIVTGKDDWLYWKGDWYGGQCQTTSDTEMAVSRMDAMLDIADVSGIDMYFAVSPDKSTIYPEFLDPHFKKYWACKDQNARLLRSTISAKAPRVIDHLKPLLEAKRNPTGNLLYSKADTHWTGYGAALGFRQLLATIFPDAKALPPPAVTGKMTLRPADLETIMLLVGNGHEESEIDLPAEKQALSSVKAFDHANSTVILHDSFYNKIVGLTEPFRHAVEYNMGDDPKAVMQAILGSQRLIVSRVERAAVDSMLRGPIAWFNPLGLALVERDKLAAKECTGFSSAPSEPKLQTMVKEGGGYLATGPDPQIAAIVPVSGNGTPCVRLKLMLKNPDIFEIFFPPRGNEDGPFVAGRSIQLYLEAGDHEIALVLPNYVANRTIRIDPGDSGQQTTVRDVEFGWRTATGAAAP